MPQSAAGYIHRIGRTGRAYNTGASVSLVSPEENDMFEDIKSFIGESDNVDSNFIAPFPLLTKNAVEGLRYRAEKELAQLTCECERHMSTQSGGMEQIRFSVLFVFIPMGARCSKLGFCWWPSNLKSNIACSFDFEQCGENETMKLPSFKECSLH
ncbi:uncharacterized protein [Coffea arabica]|uniref:Uncharacterized protein isoform X1 n=1 Tax=Coffea arabica TaxID=13443 RepID=A0ABM4WQH5_COFAR